MNKVSTLCITPLLIDEGEPGELVPCDTVRECFSKWILAKFSNAQSHSENL